MTSASKYIREWILFPFLLPVFFVLHAYQFYYGFVPATDLLCITVAYLAVSCILFLLLRIILKNNARAGMLTFLLLVVALYWGDILLLVKAYFPHAFFARIPVSFAGVLAIVVVLYIAFSKLGEQSRRRIVFLLNVLFFIYLGVDAGIILSASRHDRSLPVVHYAPGNNTSRKNWNVYFLLFDEYASSRSLLQDHGHDNSSTDSFLLQKGFSIQRNSRSNYDVTYFSMASALQMSYLEKIKNIHALDLRDYNLCVRWIKDNEVVKAWKQAGYRFRNYTFFEMAGQLPLTNDKFLVEKSKLITSNTLYDRFIHDYLQFFRSAAANKKAIDTTYFENDDYNNDIVRRLVQSDSSDVSPVFVYAHFAVPHSPFYYNAAGHRLPADSAIAVSVAIDPQYYWYNVQHANKDMREVVDAILAREQGKAAIVILGDHGFRGHAQSNDPKARFRNINAVYFPDRDYSMLYDSISNVNMFRVLLNKITGSTMPLLRDSSIFLSDKGGRIQ